MVNAADRGKATKHSNQRQNVRVPTGVTYKGEPRMAIKIRFTQNSFTEVEMSQSLSATYKRPHTHRQHMAVALFKLYQGDFLNKPYISLQLGLFFSRSLRVGSCAAVNGCVCYIRIRRQKKLSLRYFVLFFFKVWPTGLRVTQSSLKTAPRFCLSQLFHQQLLLLINADEARGQERQERGGVKGTEEILYPAED